jgi:hypothetical protein
MYTHLSEYLHPGDEENRYARSHDLKLLRIVMVLVGVISIAGIYPLMMPSGWTWHTLARQPHPRINAQGRRCQTTRLPD